MPEENTSPKKTRRSGSRPLRQATVRYLATNLSDAHIRWAKMATADRQRVMEAIRMKYGWGFATEFKKIADRGSHTRPGIITGESRFNRQQLERKGYTFVKQIAPGYEQWVHPGGRVMFAFVDKAMETGKKVADPIPKPPGGSVQRMPDQLPPIDTIEESVAAFGDIIAEKEIKIWGGTYLADVHDDGTIVLISEKTGERTIMRIQPGTAGDGLPSYTFYKDNGEMDNIYMQFDVSMILE